jgi:hypothetical protein
MLKKIAMTDTIRPRKWKVESVGRWEISGATEPEESGGAVVSYEDVEGNWRPFGSAELSPNYGLHNYIDRLVIDSDVPAWLVMPFLDALGHSLRITVSSPFSVDDIPF